MKNDVDWASKLHTTPLSKLSTRERKALPKLFYSLLWHRRGSWDLRRACKLAGINWKKARKGLRSHNLAEKLRRHNTTAHEVGYTVLRVLFRRGFANPITSAQRKRELVRRQKGTINSLKWLLRNSLAIQRYLVNFAHINASDQNDLADFLDLDEARFRPLPRIVAALRQFTSEQGYKDLNATIKALRSKTFSLVKPEQRLLWDLVEELNALINSKHGFRNRRRGNPDPIIAVLDGLGFDPLPTPSAISRHLRK